MQPIDIAIAWLKKKNPRWVAADFGCGDAELGRSVPQAVHSLDLVATVPGVTACNMAHTSLGELCLLLALNSLFLPAYPLPLHPVYTNVPIYMLVSWTDPQRCLMRGKGTPFLLTSRCCVFTATTVGCLQQQVILLSLLVMCLASCCKGCWHSASACCLKHCCHVCQHC